MYTLEQMDGSRNKRERRRILHEICVRETGLLATNYPGPLGRSFIRQLQNDRPNLAIALVCNGPFKRDVPGDSLEGIKKIRGDIFDIMQTHDAPVIDIDLFGGLSLEHWKKIETAPHWEKLFLTCTNIFRHKRKKPLLKKKEDLAGFMAEWSKDNSWQPPLMPQLPYRRPNKNAIMGVVDNRGPMYWTFFLQR